MTSNRNAKLNQLKWNGLMRWGFFAGAIIGIAIYGHAFAKETNPVGLQPNFGLDAEKQLIGDAFTHANNGDDKGTRDLLDVAVESPQFSSLSESQRHWALYLLAVSECDLGEKKNCLKHSKAAVAIGEPSGAEWKLVQEAAFQAGEPATEADALITLARQWPATLATYRDGYFIEVARRLKAAQEVKRRADFLNALADSNWHKSDNVTDVSALWFWLALIRLENNDPIGATAAAERITDETLVIQMQADKRFDPVIAAEPERFDPVEVTKRHLAIEEEASLAEPNRIEPIYIRAICMTELDRSEDALKLLDATLAKAKPTNSAASPFMDEAKFLIWIMDTRSRILLNSERYDEAILEEKLAAKHVENGDQNVSQTLNLADFYVRLDRPTEALEAIKDGDELNMSPYGRTVYAHIRVCAAEEAHDGHLRDLALAYLKVHSQDGQGSLRDGLACVGDITGLGDAIIAALANPDSRSNTLLELQEYKAVGTKTPHDLLVRTRLKTALERPDVQAAIEAVGHIRTISLVQTLN